MGSKNRGQRESGGGEVGICPPKLSLFQFNTSSFKKMPAREEYLIVMNVCVKS